MPTLRPQREWEDPSVFGKYNVGEKLGTGGMATVHVAEMCGPHGFRRRVALKRLLPQWSADAEYVELFLHEARLAAQLRHPNIATVYDSGKIDGEHYLAMELVRGPSLKQLVKQCRATVGLVPYPIVVHILTQVCEALAYAHQLDIIHRDVTPTNIVVSNGGIAKLIDFGVAKSRSSVTRVGVIKGKLAYVAPEYVDGQLDRRVDLWGLGVVAYEILTNQRLFDADDDIELVRLVQEAPITPPSRFNPDLPPELEAIVMTCLERDPARRWQNASAMRTALATHAREQRNAPSYGDVAEWIEWAFAMRAVA